jgi:sarcosine oxidase subunit gamma
LAVGPVTLAERFPASVIEVAALRSMDALAGALGCALGFPVSAAALSVSGDPAGEVAALCVGPGRWLVVGDARTHEARSAALHALRAASAAVVDLSHGRTLIELRGERARDVLAMGCSLDWDAPELAPPRATATALGHFDVTVHVRGPSSFDLLVARSYALSAWEWLRDAAAGLGAAGGAGTSR